MLPDFEHCYRAIRTRDARFDGWFFVGVTSTGIYCRPSCPARTPKPSNVRFFASPAAAQAAGLRACRRCRPDAVPGSPEWDARGDVVARAMRLVRDGVVDREGVDGLAGRVGYTPRHLNRLLVAEVGAGPLSLARAQRAHTARLLLETTDLPVTEIAFAAGFGSVRQFNDTVREVFAMPPTEVRAKGRRTPSSKLAGRPGSKLAGRPASTPGSRPGSRFGRPTVRSGSHGDGNSGPAGTDPARTDPVGTEPAGTDPLGLDAVGIDAVGMGPVGMGPVGMGPVGTHPASPEADRPIVRAAVAEVTVRLPARAPYDPWSTWRFLAARAVPGLEEVAGTTYRRALRLPHGFGVATLEPAGDHIRCRLELEDLRDLGAAASRCRRLLDLDADPVGVLDVLGGDPLIGPLVQRNPGLRVPGTVDPFEIAVRAVVGQQVSVASARGVLARMVAAYGDPLPRPVGSVTHAFPSADALAVSDGLPMPRSRAATIRELATAAASGKLSLHPGVDRADTYRSMVELRGIGPWTASYVLLRGLGDPDAFPEADLGLRYALARLGADDRPAAVRTLAERWRPLRSYAAQHLWHHISTERSPQ